MKTSLSRLKLIILLGFFTSCSKDDANDASVIGIWDLTTWTINIPIDLNNDTVSSINLLDEAMCTNQEKLIFETNGVVSSNATYNPHVMVWLLDGSVNDYDFEVVCDTEGTIGYAGTYEQNGNSVRIVNKMATIDGNTLTIVYESVIPIYNEDLSEIIDQKDLTLIYTRS